MDVTRPDASDNERRQRRARRRIYETIGVGIFMTLVLLALMLYVKANAP